MTLNRCPGLPAIDSAQAQQAGRPAICLRESAAKIKGENTVQMKRGVNHGSSFV